MTADSEKPPSSVFSFSLDDVPERDRAATMFEYFGRHMRRILIEATDREAPLKCDAQVRIIPGASWGIAQLSQVTAHRTAPMLEDGCDDVMLFAPSSGVTVSPQGGVELEIAPGSALLMSQARAARTAYHGPAETFAFRFPRAQLSELIPTLGEAPCVEIPRSTPGLALLFRYGRLLHDDPLAQPALRTLAARHLQELAALVIGAAPDAAEHAKHNSVSAARLRVFKAEIAANLGNPNFGIKVLAMKHKVTTRYIQMLFERDGTTFTGFLRRSRVERAYRMLADPRLATRSIVSIALDCGFAEAASLNRAFRQELGMTPGDVRRIVE